MTLREINARNSMSAEMKVDFVVNEIYPLRIELDVTVSSKATVWCAAWPMGDTMTAFKLQTMPGMILRRTFCIELCLFHT